MDFSKKVFQIKHVTKLKQPSFDSKNKYDVLNCNNEQPDIDFKKNVQSVQVEHKQEAPIVSDIITTVIKIETITRHTIRKLLVTLTTNLEIKLS